MSADLGAETVLERSDDPAAVGVVLRVGSGHHKHIERKPQDVAADLDVTLLHHVEHRDLDPLSEVGELVDGHDAAMTARDQTKVDRLGVTQAASLGHLHRIDVADQVGDARVRSRELFRIPLIPAAPRDRQGVTQLGGTAQALCRDGLEGVLTQLGAPDDRRPLIEQADQSAQQTGLALSTLAQQHDVVPGDEGPLELRDDGRLKAVQARPRVAALAEGGKEVVADLDAQGLLDVARSPKCADGCHSGSSHLHNATAEFNRSTTPADR